MVAFDKPGFVDGQLARGRALRAQAAAYTQADFVVREPDLMAGWLRFEDAVVDVLTGHFSDEAASAFRDARTLAADQVTLLDLMDMRLASLEALRAELPEETT